MIKYYSTQRPIGPGTCPMENIVEIKNFDTRKFCPEINREAWGYIIYSQPLSEKEASNYELLCYQNPLTEEKCKHLINAILKGVCDEKIGNYFIFYMPENEHDISNFNLERLSESDDPESDMDDMISDIERRYCYDYLHGHLADMIRDKLETKFTPEQVDERMECIDDYVEEYCLAKYQMSEFDGIHLIPVVIALDTGDANYDFSTNKRERFFWDNSLAWLAKQQGQYEELYNAIVNNINEYDDDGNLKTSLSPFVRTALAEMDEYGAGGILCFLVTMSLTDFVNLKKLVNSEKALNQSYYYKERKGEKHFFVTKDSVCGLYYPSIGGGSLFQIELKKDVKLQTKDIFDIWIDTGKEYPFGCNNRGYQISYTYEMYPDDFVGSINVG